MSKKSLIKESIKNLIENPMYKAMLLVIICFNIYATMYLSYGEDYFSAFVVQLSKDYYQVFILAFILVNSIITIKEYDSNVFYIVRFKSKEEYLKRLIINVVVSNSLIFLLNFLILLVGNNIFVGPNFVITNAFNYNIPNYIYTILYILKTYAFMVMLGVFIALIYKKTDVIGSALFYVAIIIHLMTKEYNYKYVIPSVTKMYFNIADYLRVHFYTNFALEIECTCIFMLILLFILFALYLYVNKTFKKIGE